ncbi:hypothetical protein HJFPF1_01096 [Paramyrothecium foliicola]|nr:hypothetical protein HJFPF1_01096 [Paramyrothecium foliicola]
MSSSPLPTLVPRPVGVKPSDQALTPLPREHAGTEWEVMKPHLKRLYVDESRTLRQTMDIMRRRHGFAASEQMYKKRFKKWEFRKQSYKKRARVCSTSSSPAPPTEISETSSETEYMRQELQTGSSDADVSLVRMSRLELFDGLEQALDSSSSWSQSKLEASQGGFDPMSRYLSNPTQPLLQDSRTMYRTFELVFDLWRRGRGDLAGMAARRGFYVLEFVLGEDHPDLVWHVLDTIYDMIDRAHLQLLQMFLSHAHELALMRLPANHPLLRMLCLLRSWDYRTEQGRQHACFLLKQAWLRNVDLLSKRISSPAPQQLWLYEQLIWDGWTKLRRGNHLAQKQESIVAALQQLAASQRSEPHADGSVELRIEALSLEFTQMDLNDKQEAEQLALKLLRHTETHPDARASDRFHAYARKMLARIQEEQLDLVNAEGNLQQAVTKREAAHGAGNNLRVIRDMWVLANYYERVGRLEDAGRVTADALERAQQYLTDTPGQ